jgi:nucleotide-binding universal stress UspA family protein
VSAPFRRVLVGVDGSGAAEDAVELALRLVDADDGELLLAHVNAHRALRLPRGRRRPADDVLGPAIAALPAGLRVRPIERDAASAAGGLCEGAEEERADLLVVGSHHDGPEGRTTPGSTALRLLQGAPCAVAVAPVGLREHGRFHHVGVAYDGSAEARRALDIGYFLAGRDGAAVTLYRAISRVGMEYAGAIAQEMDAAAQARRKDATDQLDAAADVAPAGVNPRTLLVHDAPSTITKACDGIVDLLVIGSRGYGPMHRVLAGSVSLELLLDASQPVIVVPRASAAGTTLGTVADSGARARWSRGPRSAGSPPA